MRVVRNPQGTGNIVNFNDFDRRSYFQMKDIDIHVGCSSIFLNNFGIACASASHQEHFIRIQMRGWAIPTDHF